MFTDCCAQVLLSSTGVDLGRGLGPQRQARARLDHHLQRETVTIEQARGEQQTHQRQTVSTGLDVRSEDLERIRSARLQKDGPIVADPRAQEQRAVQ
jgi:hypothetical protein